MPPRGGFGRRGLARRAPQQSRVFRRNVPLPEFLETFYRDDVFSATCGVTPAVFAHIFMKYCGPFASEHLRSVNQLYSALHYLKNYAVQREHGPTLNGNVAQAPAPLWTRINSTIQALANVIDELDIKEHDQLPAPWFPGVGGSVDGFAVYCRTPKKDLVAKAFISGKYNAACVKFDIVVNHRGVPLWFGGPYLVRAAASRPSRIVALTSTSSLLCCRRRFSVSLVVGRATR